MAACIPMSNPIGVISPRCKRANGKSGKTPNLADAEDRGHHELINWFCLAGAMAELKRKPDEAVFLESWITNSDKVFAVFRP